MRVFYNFLLGGFLLITFQSQGSVTVRSSFVRLDSSAAITTPTDTTFLSRAIVTAAKKNAKKEYKNWGEIAIVAAATFVATPFGGVAALYLILNSPIRGKKRRNSNQPLEKENDLYNSTYEFERKRLRKKRLLIAFGIPLAISVVAGILFIIFFVNFFSSLFLFG